MKPPKASAGEDLLARYRAGDSGAFRELVDLYQERLLQFFYRLCWDRDRAEDLTQELFIKLIQGARRYRPQGRLSTFVYRVATNLWIDHYRATRPRRRLVSLDQVVFEDGPQDPSDQGNPVRCATDGEEKLVLRKALESLTEPHRIVFELAVYQERPYAEISELLRIPVGTVKSRMHNAVHALKRMLERSGTGGQGRTASGDGARGTIGERIG
ncbi:MAG: sigma-70 family RNA polymerase sigma factor [Planctomycetota bacterium]